MSNIIRDQWNNFWFKPVSPAPICLFRIFYGLLLLGFCASWSICIRGWFGHNPLFSQTTLSLWHCKKNFPPDLFVWLPHNVSDNTLLLVVYALAAACVTVGLFTRPAILVAWAIMLSLQSHYSMLIAGNDRLIALFGLPLFFAPAGAMFSLDCRRRHKNTNQVLYAPWAQRLIQLHVAAVYWQAFWSKLEDHSWWQGTAVYYVLHASQFQGPLSMLLFDNLWICRLLTWVTLAIELSLSTLVWFKACRYWVLLLGIILHAGTGLFMYMPLYDLIMIASFINFVEPVDLERLLSGIKKITGQFLNKLRMAA